MTDKSKKAVWVYDKIAQLYAKEFSEPSDYIDNFLSQLPVNWTVLDLGCWCWFDSWYMQSKWFNVVWIDLSSEMLNIAKENYPSINFQLEDIREIKFPSSYFDWILASFSLIHIPKIDILKVIENLYNMLKKDWFIYIGLQSGDSKEICVKEPFKPDEQLFLNIISLEEIEWILSKIWFRIISKNQRIAQSKEELDFIKLFIIAKKSLGTQASPRN